MCTNIKVWGNLEVLPRYKPSEIFTIFRLVELTEIPASDSEIQTLALKVELSPQKPKLTKECIILQEDGNPSNHTKIVLHARVLGRQCYMPVLIGNTILK